MVPSSRRHKLASLFPELQIVRFNRRQDRLMFFSIVNELALENYTILDFGAGRNRFTDYGRHLELTATLKGRCARVVGIDVDDAVFTNDALDEAYQIKVGERIPLPDSSVDLIYSYAVFEHVADPDSVASELRRILKPGGWICAWTPNKWGYVGIGARLIPNKWHTRLLNIVQPGSRGERDVFPVVYKLNTKSSIQRYFSDNYFENKSFYYNAQPSYNFGSPIIARAWLFYMAIMPKFFSQSLMIFLQKKDT